MSAVLAGLATGVVVGIIFGALRLAPPAPASWAGVAGIAGILAGWQIVSRWMA